MNKKVLTVFSCGALLLTLSGCGQAKTEPSDSDAWLIKMGDEEVTKGDVYNELVAQNNVTPVVNEINDILTNKVVKTDAKIEKEANKQLKQVKKALGKDFEKTIKAQGYKDEKQFLNEVIIPGVKIEKLPEKYFEEDYENLSEEYGLHQMQVMYLNDKKVADKAQKALDKGDKFEDVAKKYGNDEAFSPVVAIYAEKDSTIPKKVLDKALELENGKNTGVVATGTNKSYMVIKMIEKDPMKFKKDGIGYFTQLAKNQDQAAQAQAQQQAQMQQQDKQTTETSGELTNQAFTYFLKKYDFSAHDIDIYQALIDNSKKYKVTD